MTTLEHRGATLLPITDREFDLFQTLIHREAGIYLSPAKRALLVGRLSRRLRELGLTSFGAYYNKVTDSNNEEKVLMLDCICTNETRFFREPQHFEFLEQCVFPEWRTTTPRRIRVWSAACSTGEEPYSLAMTLLHHFPPAKGWEIEILATDLSTRVLQRAQAALWAIEKAKEIPSSYLKAFMLKGTRTQEGMMKAGPEIRSLISFQRLNLNENVYPAIGMFDLIFCRNVIMYFDSETKSKVVNQLLKHLLPEGCLFLGHAESLTGMTSRVRSVGQMVYTHSGTDSLAQARPRQSL
jgi:chemotaxis protein methyltransferase CheR